MPKFCKAGHELTESNTIYRKGRGTRECRTCTRSRKRKYVKTHRVHLSAVRQRQRQRDKIKTLMARYGQSRELYLQLFSRQNGECAICGSHKHLLVDHDHKTGHIRGLLCRSCNLGLGFFLDNVLFLQMASSYIYQSLQIEEENKCHQ